MVSLPWSITGFVSGDDDGARGIVALVYRIGFVSGDDDGASIAALANTVDTALQEFNIDARSHTGPTIEEGLI